MAMEKLPYITGPDQIRSKINEVVDFLNGNTFSGTGFKITGLPTADPHVVGQIWSNSGALTVSAG